MDEKERRDKDDEQQQQQLNSPLLPSTTSSLCNNDDDDDELSKTVHCVFNSSSTKTASTKSKTITSIRSSTDSSKPAPPHLLLPPPPPRQHHHFSCATTVVDKDVQTCFSDDDEDDSDDDTIVSLGDSEDLKNNKYREIEPFIYQSANTTSVHVVDRKKLNYNDPTTSVALPEVILAGEQSPAQHNSQPHQLCTSVSFADDDDDDQADNNTEKITTIEHYPQQQYGNFPPPFSSSVQEEKPTYATDHALQQQYDDRREEVQQTDALMQSNFTSGDSPPPSNTFYKLSKSTLQPKTQSTTAKQSGSQVHARVRHGRRRATQPIILNSSSSIDCSSTAAGNINKHEAQKNNANVFVACRAFPSVIVDDGDDPDEDDTQKRIFSAPENNDENDNKLRNTSATDTPQFYQESTKKRSVRAAALFPPYTAVTPCYSGNRPTPSAVPNARKCRTPTADYCFPPSSATSTTANAVLPSPRVLQHTVYSVGDITVRLCDDDQDNTAVAEPAAVEEPSSSFSGGNRQREFNAIVSHLRRSYSPQYSALFDNVQPANSNHYNYRAVQRVLLPEPPPQQPAKRPVTLLPCSCPPSHSQKKHNLRSSLRHYPPDYCNTKSSNETRVPRAHTSRSVGSTQQQQQLHDYAAVDRSFAVAAAQNDNYANVFPATSHQQRQNFVTTNAFQNNFFGQQQQQRRLVCIGKAPPSAYHPIDQQVERRFSVPFQLPPPPLQQQSHVYVADPLFVQQLPATSQQKHHRRTPPTSRGGARGPGRRQVSPPSSIKFAPAIANNYPLLYSCPSSTLYWPGDDTNMSEPPPAPPLPSALPNNVAAKELSSSTQVNTTEHQHQVDDVTGANTKRSYIPQPHSSPSAHHHNVMMNAVHQQQQQQQQQHQPIATTPARPFNTLNNSNTPYRFGPHASLGNVFLQCHGETKRAVLPNEITTYDTVRALFVRAFPKQLTFAQLEESYVKIYILEPRTGIYYELEDLRDIADGCVLRLNDPNTNTTPVMIANHLKSTQQQSYSPQMLHQTTMQPPPGLSPSTSQSSHSSVAAPAPSSYNAKPVPSSISSPYQHHRTTPVHHSHFEAMAAPSSPAIQRHLHQNQHQPQNYAKPFGRNPSYSQSTTQQHYLTTEPNNNHNMNGRGPAVTTVITAPTPTIMANDNNQATFEPYQPFYNQGTLRSNACADEPHSTHSVGSIPFTHYSTAHQTPLETNNNSSRSRSTTPTGRNIVEPVNYQFQNGGLAPAAYGKQYAQPVVSLPPELVPTEDGSGGYQRIDDMERHLQNLTALVEHMLSSSSSGSTPAVAGANGGGGGLLGVNGGNGRFLNLKSASSPNTPKLQRPSTTSTSMMSSAGRRSLAGGARPSNNYPNDPSAPSTSYYPNSPWPRQTIAGYMATARTYRGFDPKQHKRHPALVGTLPGLLRYPLPADKSPARRAQQQQQQQQHQSLTLQRSRAISRSSSAHDSYRTPRTPGAGSQTSHGGVLQQLMHELNSIIDLYSIPVSTAQSPSTATAAGQQSQSNEPTAAASTSRPKIANEEGANNNKSAHVRCV